MLFRPKGGTAVAFLACALTVARGAFAQTDAQLEIGRKLFTEALAEEERKSYDVALEKYRRIQEIKDTTNVRYRIAVCLDRLGHPGAAMAAYEAAVTLGESDPANATVVGTAKGRATELRGLVAELTVVPPAPAPPALRVEVDGASLLIDKLDKPLLLDPGDHKVVATATGFVPFRAAITIPAAGHASIQLAMPPLSTPAVGANPAEDGRTDAAHSADTGSTDARDANGGSSALGTLGWLTLSVGALAGVGAAAIAIDRTIRLNTYNGDCPQNHCPVGANPSPINSLASTINTEGNIAPWLAGGAAVVFGAGLYMILSSNRHAAPSHVTMMLEPVLAPGVVGLAASGSL